MVSNLTTGARLGLGFGFVLLLLVASVVLAVSRLHSLSDHVEKISARDWPKIWLLHETMEGVSTDLRSAAMALVRGDRNILPDLIESRTAGLEDQLKLLKPMLYAAKGQEIYEAASKEFAAYREAARTLAGAIRSNADDREIRELGARYLISLDRLSHELDMLMHLQGSLIQADAGSAKQAVDDGKDELLRFLAIAVLAAQFSAVWIVRSVTRPLGGEPEDATAIARRIAGGDLDTGIAVKKGDNSSLLAAMKDMQAAMRGMIARLRADREKIEVLNRELDDRVNRRTAELTAANKDLERFGHAVAHDLRAPLRAISGFSGALAADCGRDLTDECKGYLDRIMAGSKRMDDMTSGLLSLARLGHQNIRFGPVDLTGLANAIIAELQCADPARHVETVIAPNLAVEADPDLMQVVIQNLIANAWKFTRMAEKPTIEVGIAENEGRTAFYVRDNGIGFDIGCSAGLFQPFRRLHSDATFEGTGIGLATVKSVIERHGGEIWAESSPGKGATFYFTLRKK